MYEDIIKKIEEKEKELWIVWGYKNWTNEMFEFIHKNRYDTIEIYDIIIWPHIRMPSIITDNMSNTMKEFQRFEWKKVWLYKVEWTYVYKWTAWDCDVDYCEKNNIPIIDFWQPSWTFVISNWSLWLAYNHKLLLPIENMYIYNKIREYLWAIPMWNDYIIKWYKVAWLGFTMWLQVQHLSFTVDIDLIKNICKKKMIKEPKWITELTWITRTDFLERLKTWFIY